MTLNKKKLNEKEKMNYFTGIYKKSKKIIKFKFKINKLLKYENYENIIFNGEFTLENAKNKGSFQMEWEKNDVSEWALNELIIDEF
jgi:hypothetical protein